MLNQFVGGLKDNLQGLRRDLPNRSEEVVRQARTRLRAARGQSVERLWNLQVETLTRVEQALEKAPGNLPVLSRVADEAEKLVSRRLEAVTAAPLAEYDTLPAKDVRAALSGLGQVDLLALRRYEQAHKARKTVLADVERELNRRLRTEPVAAVVEEEAA